jgi:hypothetical protein
MSLKYRAMIPYDRPVAAHPADGEIVHQAAIDRWQLFTDYRPPELKKYLESGGTSAQHAQTTSVPRGTPCP